MVPEIGIGKILLILVVVLLLFGAKRVPEIGSSLGRAIREFQRSLNELQRDVHLDGSGAPRGDLGEGAERRRPPREAPGGEGEGDDARREPKRLLT